MKQTNMRLSLLVPAAMAAVRSVIIGDSMYWSGPLFFGGQPSPLSKWLETWSGHSIENHALVGASLEEGWIKSIPSQYRDLNKTPNITTLIMDGGGNDVMSHKSECEEWKPSCQTMIDQCAGIAESLLEKAYTDGIQRVLYLGFYYLPGLERAADAANPLLAQVCANATIECHFVDPRYNSTTGTGLPTPAMLGPDGLHPTTEGYKILAQMIWDTVVHYNITL
uniref:SGNH hydrolase-type esterase domain-containing protein n=1 Tax=viral metagenome TaxID=1070528 RepID=A0A6C0ICG5_9ZZZZ